MTKRSPLLADLPPEEEFWKSVKRGLRNKDRFPLHEAVERARDRMGVPQIVIASWWTRMHMHCWYEFGNRDTNQLFRDEGLPALKKLIDSYIEGIVLP